MHPRTRELLDYLDAQRAALRAAFDAVPPDARDRPPAPGQWSAAAVVEHLAIVDARIAKVLAKRVAEGRPAGVGPATSTNPVLPEGGTALEVHRPTRGTA